jgi:hypothetical protein
MINPQSLTEQLLFSTIKINTNNGSGTGFLFYFKDGENQYPVIITNKHVVEGADIINLSLHIGENGKPTNDNLIIDYQINWIKHPKYDLCCAFFNPLVEWCKTQFGKEIFYRTFQEENIWSNIKLNDLKAMEDIVMIGYPTGLWDEAHNLPLFRKGVTSSHPALNFNGKSEGVIDAACFPGSSGSPVCILNEGSYVDKLNNTIMGNVRFSLLGVLYAGPVYDAEGNINVREIPTKQEVFSSTHIMINLGYYIKASEILELKKEVLNFVKSGNKLIRKNLLRNLKKIIYLKLKDELIVIKTKLFENF